MIPIALHSFNNLFGISNGLYFHLSACLTNLISSNPKGLPCEEDLPDLFGEPYPIFVLQEITVGFLHFELFLKLCKFDFHCDHLLIHNPIHSFQIFFKVV